MSVVVIVCLLGSMVTGWEVVTAEPKSKFEMGRQIVLASLCAALALLAFFGAS